MLFNILIYIDMTLCVCVCSCITVKQKGFKDIFCINNHKTSNNKLYYSDLGGHQRAWHVISNQMKHLTKLTERASLP